MLDRTITLNTLPKTLETSSGHIIGTNNINNYFNKYFSSIGSDLAVLIKHTYVDPLQYMRYPQGNDYKERI